MLTPASISVANWREKIWSALASTFLRKRRPALRGGLGLARSEPGSSPRRRSCSLAASRSGAKSCPVSSKPSALTAE